MIREYFKRLEDRKNARELIDRLFSVLKLIQYMHGSPLVISSEGDFSNYRIQTNTVQEFDSVNYMLNGVRDYCKAFGFGNLNSFREFMIEDSKTRKYFIKKIKGDQRSRLAPPFGDYDITQKFLPNNI